MTSDKTPMTILSMIERDIDFGRVRVDVSDYSCIKVALRNNLAHYGASCTVEALEGACQMIAHDRSCIYEIFEQSPCRVVAATDKTVEIEYSPIRVSKVMPFIVPLLYVESTNRRDSYAEISCIIADEEPKIPTETICKLVQLVANKDHDCEKDSVLLARVRRIIRVPTTCVKPQILEDKDPLGMHDKVYAKAIIDLVLTKNQKLKKSLRDVAHSLGLTLTTKLCIADIALLIIRFRGICAWF